MRLGNGSILNLDLFSLLSPQPVPMHHASPPPKLALQGATVLTPTGWLTVATVLIEEGQIVAVDQTSKPSGYMAIDVTELQLVPGLVDIHGDAFERNGRFV